MVFPLFPPRSLPDPDKKIKCHYQNIASLNNLSNVLAKILSGLNPLGRRDLIVLGIGTDRSTGDCLGPLVGWQLQLKKVPFSVYGTLDEPVHAGNLSEKLTLIKENHHDPLIIAVDACLGRLESIGMVTLGEGEIKPGAGVHKRLPPVGDIYFTGIVNVAGHMEFIVLQNTRLSIVMRMASLISNSILLGIKKAQKNLVSPTLEK